MASTNQSPFYKQAEAKFLAASTNEEKLKWLEEMIRECPKHKSSEKMLANLKTRHIKLKEKIASQRKTSKGSKKSGIKKEEMQAVIIGKTNSGKSTLLSLLTNTNPEIAEYDFTTKTPLVGMMSLSNVPIQIVENPAIESEYYDRGLTNTTDTLLIIVNSLEEIGEIEKIIKNLNKKEIIIFNNFDKSESELRKLDATLRSRKYNYVLINLNEINGLWMESGSKKESTLETLKEKIFQSFNKTRVFTKEPGKSKSEKPIILEPNSTVEQVAEKIFHGFSKQVKETKIWGPSSKFPGQIVGLKHILKDLDVVEFKTR